MKPIYKVFIEVAEEVEPGEAFETVATEMVFSSEDEDEALQFAADLAIQAFENQ